MDAAVAGIVQRTTGNPLRRDETNRTGSVKFGWWCCAIRFASGQLCARTEGWLVFFIHVFDAVPLFFPPSRPTSPSLSFPLYSSPSPPPGNARAANPTHCEAWVGGASKVRSTSYRVPVRPPLWRRKLIVGRMPGGLVGC